MRVLVTGASGNLGSRIVEAMRGRHEVTAVDIVAGNDADLRVAGPWTDIFAGQDAVIHLAGDRRPEATWDDVLDSNVTATLNVYDAAATHGVNRVVLASSVWAAGGAWTGGPIPAAIAAPGSNAYGASKVSCEEIGRRLWATRGITTVALRLGGCAPGDTQPIRQNPWEDSCWLSPRDAVSALSLATEQPLSGFHILPVTSANAANIWDLQPAFEAIGYAPRDTWEPVVRSGRYRRLLQSRGKSFARRR